MVENGFITITGKGRGVKYVIKGNDYGITKYDVYEKKGTSISMRLDFTLSKFRSLCSTVAQHYPTLTLSEYFQGNDFPPRFAMMRHDIDRKQKNALFTARVEAESGIRAAYYFRRYGSTYRPEIMKEIEGMGHEVGYHYEVLGKAKGDHERAIKMFEDELEEFREICDVRTISMHGNTLSKYGDLDLWKEYDFRDS
jgi:hypothetical protein